MTAAAVLPGSGQWLTQGENDTSVCAGPLDGGSARRLTFGGKKSFEHGIIAMRGLDASTAVMSDGVFVTRLALSEGGALEPSKRWRLPGELGWRANLHSSADGALIAVASDSRLAVYGAHEKVIQSGRAFAEHFMCVAVLPDGRRLLTGRGDGRLELRDAQTLEVLKTFSVLTEAALALCVLDQRTVAVADDLARTGLLDLESGSFTELELGRMKTSGLHRLADGRLLVVGLSRRVTVFSGTTRVAEVDLSDALGDRYVASSAVEGDTLVLACEEQGLRRVRLSELPLHAAPLNLPRPAQELRQDVTTFVAFTRFMEAIAAKEDVAPLLAPLLERNDEAQLRGVFGALQRNGLVVPEATKYLCSPIERVRFYTADQYGAQAEKYAGRALELEPLLEDASAPVVAAALWSIGRLGGVELIPAVARALTHADMGVRETAATALVTLRGGKDELVGAVRSGSGELTIAAICKLWPKLSPAMLQPLEAGLIDRLKTGLPLAELLEELAVGASPAFLAPLAAQTFAVEEPVKWVFEVIWKLALPRRWAVTFREQRLELMTAAEAADWWDAELGRRFAAA